MNLPAGLIGKILAGRGTENVSWILSLWKFIQENLDGGLDPRLDVLILILIYSRPVLPVASSLSTPKARAFRCAPDGVPEETRRAVVKLGSCLELSYGSAPISFSPSVLRVGRSLCNVLRYGILLSGNCSRVKLLVLSLKTKCTLSLDSILSAHLRTLSQPLR